MFGRQGASSTSTSASKKKKRSKTSKKQTKAEIPLSNLESQAANRILHAKSGTAAPEHTNGRTSNSQSDDKARAASKTKSASNTGAQNGRTSQVDQEDFPPLSVAASSKAPITNASSTRATKQVPLAERLAKTRPQTAVDDMVEKDDILQGEKVYSRTMRIVKPSETKPLLLDEDDDAWEQPRQEQTGDSTWQSVPIASKSAFTYSIGNALPYADTATIHLFCNNATSVLFHTHTLLHCYRGIYHTIIFHTFQSVVAASSFTVRAWITGTYEETTTKCEKGCRHESR